MKIRVRKPNNDVGGARGVLHWKKKKILSIVTRKNGILFPVALILIDAETNNHFVVEKKIIPPEIFIFIIFYLYSALLCSALFFIIYSLIRIIVWSIYRLLQLFLFLLLIPPQLFDFHFRFSSFNLYPNVIFSNLYW